MNKLILFSFLFLIIASSCDKKNKTSEFLEKYDEIRLISYNTHRDVYNSDYELIIENDSVKIPNIKPVDNIILNKYYSEKIIEVLITDEKKCVLADCYNPRHLILFYKQNKIVDFYEFCTECGGSRQSKNIKFPDICRDKGFKIITIFKEMKLKNNGEETEDYKYF